MEFQRIKMNKYQTELTEELVNSLPQEVQDQLFDIINNVEFVKRLISPTREYAKDRPRDDRGRIIVDLANPHILENMDYFRPSAIHYEKYGTFTNLRPNANPNSEYGKWIREERRRIWDGYVRESDGEWVTGYLYWFLNYSPMMLSKIREYKDKDGKKRKSKRADRVESLPECWEGIYWRFHCLDQASNGGLYNNFEGGQHMAELASRGKGKSYSLASILNHIFVVGENEEAHEKVKGIVTAYQKEYLTKDGVLNKFVDMANFCATNTQFPRKRLKNSLQEMTWIMGYKDVELDIERGTQNTVLGVSSKDDESKLRGKRAAKILIEEFGTFPRLVDLYNVLLPSVQDGDIIFGQIYMLGTAGDNESDFAGAQEIMYNPRGYNMYALPNVFDKYNQGKPYFVFFFPGYVNRKGCYNEDGVSDIIKALIEILMNRYRVKYNSTDPNTIIKTIAEVPITPAEAIVKTGVNMFPVADLTERIGQLDSNPTEYNDVYVGDLVFGKGGQVEYKPTSAQPIRDFPHKDNKIEGAIEIFQMPEIDKNTNKPYNDRYILGADPYDDDESNTMSLGSIFVLDLWTDRIVAEYTGRPSFADDYYEICRKLCLFYNGRLNYEYNKKGLFSHFSTRNSLYLLTDVLDFLKEKQMMKDGIGNKAHPYSEKVYTPDGIKRWGDIKVGDLLYSTYGGTTRVIDIPFDDMTGIYEITLKDGRKIKASGNHLWKVITYSGIDKVVSTKEMIQDYFRIRGNYKECKYYIPANMGVDFSERNTKLPPYFMGIMLGDGCFTQSKHHQAYFTSTLQDLQEYRKYIPFEVKTYDDRHHRWLVPNVGKILAEYQLIDKLSHNKFIPDEYKYNSREVRLSLLQGLLDTDGHTGYGGNPEYTTTSLQLCDDVMEVARSLGINCNKQIQLNSYGEYYKIVFYTSTPMFKLNRKLCKQRVTKNRAYKTGIVDIKYIGEEKAKCVTVDSMDSCYLIGDFITTHNSKGTNASPAINAYARSRLRSWLLSPVPVIQTIDGESKEVMVPRLFTVRNRALLKELINYNSEGNFDRISAMGMLMLLREDKMIKYQGNVGRDRQENAENSYDGEDPFFKRNYRP